MKPAVTCACRGLPGDGPSRRAACSPGARRVLKGGNRALRRSGQGPAPQRFHHLHIPSFLLCFRAVGRGGSQGRAWSGVRAASGRGGAGPRQSAGCGAGAGRGWGSFLTWSHGPWRLGGRGQRGAVVRVVGERVAPGAVSLRPQGQAERWVLMIFHFWLEIPIKSA